MSSEVSWWEKLAGGIWILFWWAGPYSVNLQSDFLLMGRAVSPPCCLARGQTMVGIMKVMSFTTFTHTVGFSASDPSAGHCRPRPLPETPGYSQAMLVQFLLGTLLLSPGSWCTQFLFMLSKSDKPREHIENRDIHFVDKGLSSQSYGFSSSHLWMLELDHKESWALKNWCFWTVVLEKTLESPLDCKEIKPINPKRNQSWIFVGRTDAEAEDPILWPPDVKNWLIWKDPDAGKDWRQEERGITVDEMVG